MDNVEPFTNQRSWKDTVDRAMRLMRPGKKDAGADPEGVVNRPDQLIDVHASLVILCKDVADRLVKRYPGWSWAVQPDQRGHVINIYNLHCHSMYGYTVRLVDIQDDPRHRAAIKGGHEILRRFGMPDRMSPERLAAAPRDPMGNLIPDISDILTRKDRERAEIARKLATGEYEIVTRPEGRYLRKTR